MTKSRIILIVDDEDIYLSITRRMVEMLGMSVLLARDGVEAVTLFEQAGTRVDCVLLDIQMPGLNGIETLRLLRRLRHDVRVVIASGYVNSGNQELLEPLEPSAYLKKPFSYSNLAEVLDEVLA